jgi:hypothetical protein
MTAPTVAESPTTRLEYALERVQNAFDALGREDVFTARVNLRVAIATLEYEVNG